MDFFYVYDNQQKKGPFSLEQLKSMALDRATRVWHGGIMAWTTAENIEALGIKSTTDEKIKIIIADDHVIFRGGLRNALAVKKDIKVIGEAENGSHLLNLLKGLQPDVILLDIQMPIMDGLATLPEIKKLYPGIKVIMLTMMDDQSMIVKLMKLGANSYLTKMSEAEVIYETIKTCYEHEFCFNSLTKKALFEDLDEKRAAPVQLPMENTARHKETPLAQRLREEKNKPVMTETSPIHARRDTSRMVTTPKHSSQTSEKDHTLRDAILNSFPDAGELYPERNQRWSLKIIMISIIIVALMAAIITSCNHFGIRIGGFNFQKFFGRLALVLVGHHA